MSQNNNFSAEYAGKVVIVPLSEIHGYLLSLDDNLSPEDLTERRCQVQAACEAVSKIKGTVDKKPQILIGWKTVPNEENSDTNLMAGEGEKTTRCFLVPSAFDRTRVKSYKTSENNQIGHVICKPLSSSEKHILLDKIIDAMVDTAAELGIKGIRCDDLHYVMEAIVALSSTLTENIQASSH